MITPPGKNRKYKSASSGTMADRRALEVSGTTTATEIDSSTPQQPACGEKFLSAHCGKESVSLFR
ncbi:hypothetical protein [Streptomyces sp. NPDC017890]|uniref:hypothetical protein n=1 Tax=Streptomyces sp. NPDC017890 TaxID=3365015 RepID=UPI0037ABDFC4